MRQLLGVAAIAFVLGAGVAWACTPTVWTSVDLSYNLQQLNEDGQAASVLHLYSTRDSYTGYGQLMSGFRFVCYKAAASVPAGCTTAVILPPKQEEEMSTSSPGPGPGPCYVVVSDWGMAPSGGDLTAAHCEADGATLGIVME